MRRRGLRWPGNDGKVIYLTESKTQKQGSKTGKQHVDRSFML